MSHVKTVLAAVLVSVMALSAPVGVQAKTKLTLGTASMGGNCFNMGAAIAKVFNDKATGYTFNGWAAAVTFNLTAIEDKELDFGISQGPAVCMSAIAAKPCLPSAPSPTTTVRRSMSSSVRMPASRA